MESEREKAIKEIRPNPAEKEFLTLAYNRFYDLYEEINSDEFWESNEKYRFNQFKSVFSIYNELLKYEPIKGVIEYLKKHRPPMEAEIGSDLFSTIRNIVVHFPFFEVWNDVWIRKDIVNWQREGQSIDKFFDKYDGHQQVKYRFWEADKKKMNYVVIGFGNGYKVYEKIFLRDMINERDGVRFCLVLMKNIIDSQIEEISEKRSEVS